MKKLLLILVLLALWSAPGEVFAQAEDDDNDAPIMSAWRGGNLNLGFRLGLDMLGSSAGTGSIGGLISPAMNSGAGALMKNPAELAFNTNRRHIVYDGNFSLGTSRYSLVQDQVLTEINNTIRTETDNILDDPDQVDFVPGGFRSYTDMKSANLDLNSRYRTFAVSIPVHERVAVAFSAHHPIDIAFRMDLTGFQAKIAQEQGSDDVSLRFDVLMNVGLITDLRLNMQTLNAGFGAMIFDKPEWGQLGAGLTYSYYTVRNSRYINADLSGMVVVSSADERFFNNPNDPNLNTAAGETNALYMRAQGNYKSDGNGIKFGLYYKAPKRVGVSLVYTKMPNEFRLNDPNAFAEAFLPVFVEGDDLFNDKIVVELSNLEASKPNLTTRREMQNLVDDAVFKMPSSLALGLDLSLGAHYLVFNYTNYMGELSLSYGEKSSIGKQTQHGVGFGMDFKMKDKLGGWNYALIPVRLLFLDIDGILMQSFRKYTGYSNPRYRFGVNAILGDGIATGEFDSLSDAMGFPLPTGVSWGRTYRVFDTTDIGFTMFGFPDLFFKFSVGVSLF